MLKRLYRWLIRTVIGVIVLIIVLAFVDYFTHRIRPGSVLVVTLQGPIVERGRGGVAGLLSAAEQTPLNLVRVAIDRAGRDPRIAGLALKIVDPEMEFAQAQEIAGLIKDFASHGKWTTAYMETAGELGPGNLPYIVATAAKEVSLMPTGELNLIGVGVREIFARGALDWLGVRPNFDAIGKYKSAMNVFTEKDFTPAQREEDEALVSDLYDQLVAQMADQRHLTRDAIRGIIDQAPVTAEAGLKAHLVDRLEYADQFRDRVEHHGGLKHELVDYTDYVRAPILPSLRSYDRIAVIYGSGDIEHGASGLESTGEIMSSDSMAGAFKQARDDDSVKAVVFRINSPGGSVVASELIRRAAELTADKKPVVVSMSGYGASGGYWISTPARRVFADPGTITGSIGVLAGKFNIAPMTQKWGINSAAITKGANFEMFGEFTDFTPAQQQIMHEQVLESTYQRFIKLVAQSRHLTVEQVDQIAQGRVWTGKQAAELKLVDSLGGFDAALTEARNEAKISPEAHIEIVELPERPSLLEHLLSSQVDARVALGSAWLSQPLRSLARLMALRRRVAYCPVVPVM